MTRRNKIIKTWELKLKAIRKIINSEKFALLDFERTDKYNGAIEGLFTKGFTVPELNNMMDLAHSIQREFIIEDVKTELVVEEAKKLILK
jgi:hypothetical protein